MKVIILPKVFDYFDNLVTVLYEKDYFGFEQTALEYVLELYDDIIATLPLRLHKPASKHFDKYGKNMKYAVFRVRKSKHTQWYAFFNTYKANGETIYLIRYIANNYSVAQYL
jgi:hypothetical protein